MSPTEIVFMVMGGAATCALIWIGQSLRCVLDTLGRIHCQVANHLADRDDLDADEAAERFKRAIEEAGVSVVRSPQRKPKPGEIRYVSR